MVFQVYGKFDLVMSEISLNMLTGVFAEPYGLIRGISLVKGVLDGCLNKSAWAAFLLFLDQMISEKTFPERWTSTGTAHGGHTNISICG